VSENYKKYLGGKAEVWELRGSFQLYFLKKMGLQPSCKLLDIGCGPLRAGIHLIKFLNQGNYCGVDYNESFIRAAKKIVEDKGLSEKKPTLHAVKNFDFSCLNGNFDFAIAFSVLNHCNRFQRHHFLKVVHKTLKRNGRLYITHSHWFDESMLRRTNLSLMRVFKQPGDIDQELRMPDWGFPESSDVYPILELTT